MTAARGTRLRFDYNLLGGGFRLCPSKRDPVLGGSHRKLLILVVVKVLTVKSNVGRREEFRSGCGESKTDFAATIDVSIPVSSGYDVAVAIALKDRRIPDVGDVTVKGEFQYPVRELCGVRVLNGGVRIETVVPTLRLGKRDGTVRQ